MALFEIMSVGLKSDVLNLSGTGEEMGAVVHYFIYLLT
jgi:hypothetical protein